MRARVAIAGCFAFLAGAGCWSTPPPQPAGVQNTAPSTAPTIASLPAHTVWTGRYECAQGVTAAQLTLDVEPGGRARAIFDFGPLADNPTVPNGSYRLRGTAVEADDAITVSLQPEEWIDQPDGYVMVGIQGGIDANRRALRGRMLNDSCAWLDVKRSE
ncbi:MAG: hypothetical protein AB7T06_30845 [Kofleriaceae bacterium]